MSDSVTLPNPIRLCHIHVSKASYYVLTVDPNVHTGVVLTGFYCHFDHPEQYQTMLLPVKNGQLIFTLHVRFDSV